VPACLPACLPAWLAGWLAGWLPIAAGPTSLNYGWLDCRYDIFGRYGFDLPESATELLGNLQHKIEVVGGRKAKLLFIDPVLDQALIWSRESMSLKEKRLKDAFGKLYLQHCAVHT
jgi:hypothetical protein